MSVRLCSSISLFIRLSVHLCPSICHPSISLSPCSSRSLSHVLADPVAHWNLSYNFLPLLSSSSLLSQHLLLADKSSAVCVRVTVSGCLCIVRRPDGTSDLVLLIQSKEYLSYGHESLCSDRRPGRPLLASLTIFDRCQRTSYCVDI